MVRIVMMGRLVGVDAHVWLAQRDFESCVVRCVEIMSLSHGRLEYSLAIAHILNQLPKSGVAQMLAHPLRHA